MASADAVQRRVEILPPSTFDAHTGGDALRSRGNMIERKIELLESMAEKVSNRRSRRWLNDRLLIELIPRLNAEEVRGLFAPPPWGDQTPVSPFCMTNVQEWDSFRNIDMDTEAHILKKLERSMATRQSRMDSDKIIAINAWHRVGCRTREALRHSFPSDLVQSYEERIRCFIRDSGDGDVLVLHVQDAFHRLLLHGVCEFYDLVSITTTRLDDGKPQKMTRIKKRKSGSETIPLNVSLAGFLKMARDGLF